MFGRGMKIYTVHVRPEAGAEPKPVFIREGFNFFAFLFSALWALYHRLWLPGFLLLALNGALMFFVRDGLMHQEVVTVIQLGVNALVGFQANDWRRAGLARRGYILADIAAADSLLSAQQRYFERALAR